MRFLINVTSLKFFVTENNDLPVCFRCHNLITSTKTCETTWQETTTSRTKTKTEEIDIELVV